LNIGYLGVAVAVVSDKMQNKLSSVIPFELFKSCIADLWIDLEDMNSCGSYRVLQIPKII
jgi:hypothetical protein